jgi:Peptidase family M1 domain
VFFTVLYILRTGDYTITIQEQEHISVSTGVMVMNAVTESFMLRRCLIWNFFTRAQGPKQTICSLPRIQDKWGGNEALRGLLISALFFTISLYALPSQARDVFLHHNLKVILLPAEHHIAVADSITLPNESRRRIAFTLHAGLNPTSPTPGVRISKLAEKRGAVPLVSYNIILPPGLRTFVLFYNGIIHHRIVSSGKEQARGYRETPGIISTDGVVLSGASSWYPDFGPGLVTFDLTVSLPPDWDAVSQGKRTVHVQGENADVVTWRSPEPQDEIFIIAAKFIEYTGPPYHIATMAFLRAPDEALANKYLTATLRYLDMYNRLIGPYPYGKFALVENFWETGFGMPSFTLLGPTVIRLPFIITTSYPHEVLHNWWGNGVFADYEKGNWSEGLTAYLSDHLMKEMEGNGADYRMNTLQKYADYVLGSRNFPLAKFHSRHSALSEAIGYGKSLMFFHMLRLELGDDTFRRGLREFYKQYKFRSATFTSIRTCFEHVSGRDLKNEFEQWVSRTGAPQLRPGDVSAKQQGDQYFVTITIKQVQPGKIYRLHIPVAVTLEGRDRAFQTFIDMSKRDQGMTVAVPARPLRLDVDPEFDLFRRLDRDEIPPAISQALGAKKMLVILPSRAGRGLLQAYHEFAKSLAKSGPDDVEVRLDSAVDALPLDRAVTIVGWENRYLEEFVSSTSSYGVALTKQSVTIGQTEVRLKDHSIVLTARHPKMRDLALLFVATDLADALPGLGRKLPHYHKYSYLAFEGQKPEIIVKGRWPVINSPMTVFLPNQNGAVVKVEMGKLARREPLATLAPVLSGRRNDQGDPVKEH